MKASIDSLYDCIESQEDLVKNYGTLQDELRREKGRGDRLERIVQDCRECARPFVEFFHGKYAALQQRHVEDQKTIAKFEEALQDREELLQKVSALRIPLLREKIARLSAQDRLKLQAATIQKKLEAVERVRSDKAA